MPLLDRFFCQPRQSTVALAATVVVLIATVNTVSAAAASTPPNRPNILLIAVDDLKPALGCYGDTAAKTPNIDRFATQAIRFTRAYTNQAVCAPARHALLTGFRPEQLGIYDLATRFRTVRPDAVTLPQCFKQAGWHAEAMGKIYHQSQGNGDDAASWSMPHWTSKMWEPTIAPGAPEMPPGATVDPETAKRKPLLPYAWPTIDDAQSHDGDTALRAVRRIGELANEGVGTAEHPFFLAVGFSRPHLPFVTPKTYWDRIDVSVLRVFPSQATLPQGAPNFAFQDSWELRSQYLFQGPGQSWSEAQAKVLVHGYYACTAFADAQIGRVLEALDAAGQRDRTIVVIWGDHGFHLGDHGMWCKHTNYEQANRIPLLIRAPGITSGAATAALASNVDVYPTLCSLAGLTRPAGLPGKDLGPVLRDPQHSVQDGVTHVYPRTNGKDGAMLGRAWVTATHRYIAWLTFSDDRLVADELYDLTNDPDETRNLANDPAQQTVKTALAAELAKLERPLPQVQ